MHRPTGQQALDQELIGVRIELLDVFPKDIDRACVSQQIHQPSDS